MNQWKNAWRSLALLGLVWGTASAEIVWSPTVHKTNNIAANVYEADWYPSKSGSDGTSLLPGNLYDEFTALQRIPLRVRLGSASGFGLVGTTWKSTGAAQNLSSGACITYRASRSFKVQFVNTSDKVSSSVTVPASADFSSLHLAPSVTTDQKGIQFLYSGTAKDSSTAVEIVQLGLGNACDDSNNPAAGTVTGDYATASAPFWDGASSVPAEAKSSLGGAWSSPYANAATVTAKTLAADGLMGFKATLAPTSKNPYPSAGIDLAWLASEAKANISGATGLCVTYRATAPLRAQLKQDALQYAPNYYGLDLPAQTSFKARDLPFSSFAQEKGWGYNEVLDLKRQLALRFEYKGGTASTNDVQILQVGFAGQCKDTSFAPEVLSPYKSQTTVSIAEDSVMVIPLSAIFRDRDSQSLSYSLFTAELTGEADVSIAGDTLRIEPSTNTGAGLVEITATDENGQNVQWGFDLAITDVAHAPTAAPDTFSLAEDDTLVVSGILNGVLANDEDKDGDNFVISANSNAAKGTLTFDKDDGTFTYAPAKNFCGEDSFTYTLSDAGLSSVGKAVLKVACENDAPTLSLDTTLALSLLEDFADTNLSIKASHIIINDLDGEKLALKVSTDGHTGASLRIIGSTYLLTLSSMKDFSGTSKVTLYVKDDAGDSAGVSFNVAIAAVVDAPEALPDLATTLEDKAVTIDILANDLNKDNAPLTLLKLVELEDTLKHGTATLQADSTVLYTPNADWNGTDTLFYCTANAGGNSDTALVIVTVSPVPDALAMAASPLADTSASEDFASLRLPLSLFFVDVDGDAIYTASASNGKLKASISGDSLVLASVADSNGAAVVTLTATNSLGKLSASLNVAIASVVDAPVAVTDKATTLEDQPVTIKILTNDLYISEAPLTLLELVNTPSHGSVSIAADSTLLYTPDTNFHGLDTLSYKIANSTGPSNMGFVYLTVTSVDDQPAPILGAKLADTTLNEDFLNIKIPVGGLFIDGDGDAFVLEAKTSNGKVTANLNKTQDTLHLVSVQDSNGNVEVSVGVKGVTAATLSFVLTLTPVNDKPVKDSIADFVLAAPFSQRLWLGSLFKDPDNEALVYKLTPNEAFTQSLSGDTLLFSSDTLIPNGEYHIGLSATDAAGLSAYASLVVIISDTVATTAVRPTLASGSNDWRMRVEHSQGYAQLRNLQGRLIASIALPANASQVEALAQSHGQTSVLSLGHERWLLSPATH